MAKYPEYQARYNDIFRSHTSCASFVWLYIQAALVTLYKFEITTWTIFVVVISLELRTR